MQQLQFLSACELRAVHTWCNWCYWGHGMYMQVWLVCV
jgi:hypothetical protein